MNSKNVDNVNLPAQKTAIDELKRALLVYWCLFQAFNMSQRLQRQVHGDGLHQISCRKSYPTCAQCKRLQRMFSRATKTMRRRIVDESRRLVTLQVPALIFPYNLFMNTVDRFNQVRFMAFTVCQRKPVYPQIKFLLYESLVNVHHLLYAIPTTGNSITKFAELEEWIFLQLMNDLISYKLPRASLCPLLQPVHGVSAESCPNFWQ